MAAERLMENVVITVDPRLRSMAGRNEIRLELVSPCPACGGKKQIWTMGVTTTCRHCAGSGKVVSAQSQILLDALLLLDEHEQATAPRPLSKKRQGGRRVSRRV